MKRYKTKDFYLACSFIANGIELIDSEKDGDNKTVFFSFDVTNKEDLKNTILSDFVNCECFVNVKKFTRAIKLLSNEIRKYKN